MKNFYLETSEELFSILDKIKKSHDDDITLIIPRGLPALRSIINLRILKEEAISLGKDLSVVTGDTLTKKLAQQAGLRVLDRPVEKAGTAPEGLEPRREPIQAGPPQFEDLGGEPKKDDWPGQLKEGGEIKPQVKIQPEVKKGRIISDIIRPGEKTEEPVEKAGTAPEGLEPRREPIQAVTPQFEDFGGEERKEEREEEPIIEEVEHEPSFIKAPKTRLSFKFFTKKRLITSGIIICLIVLIFISIFVLPRAQVSINPKKEAIRFETGVTASKNINSINFTDSSVPAQIFQLETEDSKKFPTTGEKDIEERAKGTIIVYNQYSSSDQTLVKTTRFLSEGGKLFRLIETTVIPGATIEEGEIIPSSKEVEVEADEPGEAHNIAPSKFTIPGFEGTPKYAGFHGRSIEPIAGGAKGRMRVVTQEDIEGALEIVSLELKNKVQEQFNKQIPDELKLLKETQSLEVVDSNSSLKADEPGKEFVVTVKVKAWGLAFKEDDIFDLIETNIADKISENKILLPATIKVDYLNAELNLDQGKADFSCQIEAQAAWKVDENQVKNELAGKNEIEVRKYLSSLSEIEGAKVVFWPFWVKKIPKNKDKIKIIIDPSL